MNADDILKAILDQNGPVTINAVDLKRTKDKQIGLIQSWDGEGQTTWTLYTHEGAVRK